MKALGNLRIVFSLFPGGRYARRDERQKAERARIASGYSSIRVSKQTHAKLRELVHQVQVQDPGWRVHPFWRRRKLGLDELLSAIADGVVQVRAEKGRADPSRAPGAMHAKPAADLVDDMATSGCMQSPDPVRACISASTDPLQLGIPGVAVERAS
jgi:hypothetical protein